MLGREEARQRVQGGKARVARGNPVAPLTLQVGEELGDAFGS